MVERVFQGLVDSHLQNLLPTGLLLASKVLPGEDLIWLERMYKEMADILKDALRIAG